MDEAGRKFIIEQDIFRGPIDLLYFLIQQKELDISEVSLSVIADQYMHFLEILKSRDLDNIGEFLDIAATLLHAKARALFPDEKGDDDEDDLLDPTGDLISQLLEYKQFKLAGMVLADKRNERRKQRGRGYKERLDFDKDAEGNPLEEVDLGSLLNVFSELMAQTLRNLPDKIVYDDISIDEHITKILERFESGQAAGVTFAEFVCGSGGNTPSREFMCGAFIACLELVKRSQVRVTQNQTAGEIRIEWVPPEERERFADEDQNVLYAEDEPGDNAAPSAESP